VAGGLDLINRTLGDGADPRQFGREIVEYLRGLLLIQEGAGTRLLNLTTEQAAEMEALAGRIPIARLVRAIRLFNEANTDLRRGLQTIPQLPLEMALVGSTLEPEGPVAAVQSPGKQQPDSTASDQRPPSLRVGGRAAHAPEAAAPERTAASERTAAPERTGVPEEERAAEPVQQANESGVAYEPAPGPQASEGPLTVEQIASSWATVLHAVRRRNPATYGALNTNCEAVEVHDGEITITFPHPFLREKLKDPQRKEEVQEALSEVLRASCRVKFVLASQYEPQRRASAPAPATAPAEPQVAQDAVDGVLDDQELEKIDRWAKERGGHTQIVES
jgi:DNA polymerase-3 subunit gamma/tau